MLQNLSQNVERPEVGGRLGRAVHPLILSFAVWGIGESSAAGATTTVVRVGETEIERADVCETSTPARVGPALGPAGTAATRIRPG